MFSCSDSIKFNNFTQTCWTFQRPHRTQGKQAPSEVPVDCIISAYFEARLTCLIMLQERGYVVKEGRALRATSRGRVLSAFLQQHFAQYVDYDFTSDMESQLDDVAGDLARLHCTHCISHCTYCISQQPHTHWQQMRRLHSLYMVALSQVLPLLHSDVGFFLPHKSHGKWYHPKQSNWHGVVMVGRFCTATHRQFQKVVQSLHIATKRVY